MVARQVNLPMSIDPPILAEAGSSGFKRYGGITSDEWHPKLTGMQANKIWRQIYDTDPLIGGAFRAAQMLIRQASWGIEVDKEKETTPLHSEIAEFADSCLRDTESTWSEILQSILSVMPYGWSCLYKSFKIRRGDSDSLIFNSKHDDGMYGWRDLEIRAQETLNQWKYDETSNRPTGWYQQAAPTYKNVYLDMSRMLHFRIDPNKGNPEGRSMLRNAYRPNYFKTRLEEIEAIGQERNLAGYPVMEVPPEIMSASPSTQQAAIRDLMEQNIQKVRRDQLEGMVIPCEIGRDGKPTGYKFRLMSAGGRDFASIDSAIQRHRSEMMISLLSEFMLLGQSSVGSFALSSDKTELFSLALGSIMDMICDVFNRDAIPELMELNGINQEYWPKMVHGDVERDDVVKLIDAFGRAAQSGLVVATDKDERHARDLMEWPQRDEQDQPMPQAQGGIPSIPIEQPVQNQDIPQPEDPPPTAMSADDAAEHLGVGRNTIMRAIKTGKLVGAKIGNSYRVMSDHLNDFMRGKR